MDIFLKLYTPCFGGSHESKYDSINALEIEKRHIEIGFAITGVLLS